MSQIVTILLHDVIVCQEALPMPIAECIRFVYNEYFFYITPTRKFFMKRNERRQLTEAEKRKRMCRGGDLAKTFKRRHIPWLIDPEVPTQKRESIQRNLHSEHCRISPASKSYALVQQLLYHTDNTSHETTAFQLFPVGINRMNISINYFKAQYEMCLFSMNAYLIYFRRLCNIALQFPI